MRFRCTECGIKCTVSLSKGIHPTTCVIGKYGACWKTESEAPVSNPKTNRIRNAMNKYGHGYPVKRIDPFDRNNDKVYDCLMDASNDTLINRGSISRAVSSKGRLRAGGYYWQPVPMTMEQARLKAAAQTSVEEFREALREFDPDAYREVFE